MATAAHSEDTTPSSSPPLPDRIFLHMGRLLEVCWLTVIGLLPLFFLGNLMRPFYPPKAMLLQFLALVMLATVIARWLLRAQGITGADVKSFLRSRVHVAAVAFAAIALVATILSLSPWSSLAGSVNRRQGLFTILSWVVVFLVLSTQLHTREQLRRLVTVLLLSSGAVALIGIIEHYVPSFSNWFLSTSYTQRSASTTGNALSLSGYLGMAMPFTLATGLLVHRRRGALARSRHMLVALGVLLAMQLWCLVLSIYSFVLLLYLVGAALFVAVFALLAVRKRWLTLTAVGGVVALLLAGTALVLPQWQNAVAGTPPHEPGTPLPADTPERLTGTLYGRARYWVHAMDVLPQAMSDPQPGDQAPMLRPLIGYGPETYLIVTQQHFPPEYRSASTSGAAFRDNPHNHYLYLATTVGLLGLGLWLVLVAGCCVMLYRLVRRTGPTSTLSLYGLAAGCALVGFLAHGVFNPIAPAEESLFWMCLALAPALTALSSAGTGTTDVQKVPASGRARSRTFVACLLVVCAMAGGVFVVRGPLMAEAVHRQALVMSLSGDPNTVFMYSRATELQPRESTYWGLLGDYAYRTALVAQTNDSRTLTLKLSLIALRQARDNQPLLAHWHSKLAEIQLYAASSIGMATVEDALASYERAAELSPRNAVIAGKTAVAHMVARDWSSAAHALSWAAQYDPAWGQTNHLKIAFAALAGEGAVATQALLYLVAASPRDLVTFAQVVATQLQPHGLAVDIARSMLPHLEAEGATYAPLAARGVLTALTGSPLQAATLLTAATEAAQPDEAETMQRVTRYLASFVPGLADALTEQATAR